MGRRINRLSARVASTVKKRGMHADGGGLYLQVSNYDSKSWVFRFAMNNRTRDMGLGPVHTISLAEAREEALKCRKMVRNGEDPIEARKLLRARRQVDARKVKTFRECSEAYISSHSAGWKNLKHSSQWSNTLATYAFPVFGDLPVQNIDIELMKLVLEPIWQSKTETASRVRGRIESILDWATTMKYREGENPARWKGHLDQILAPKSKVRKEKHHKALPVNEIGEFVARLRGQSGVSAIGLEFLILTAARTTEVIKATWDEFDLDTGVWVVPAGRMKAGKEHRVPLSPRAIEVLGVARRLKSSHFVFPGQKANAPLSNMAFLTLLKRMGVDVTVHGFRSTFRDWAAERTGHSREVIEMALAHAIGNKVEAAYLRSDLLKKRMLLMDSWAEFCDQDQIGSTANEFVVEGKM